MLRYILIATVTLLLLPFQNCSPFESARTSASLSSEGILSEAQIQGKALFAAKCAACHGPIETTDRKGRTPTQIGTAIATVPQMSNLASLNNQEVMYISVALGGSSAGEICITQSKPGHVPPHRINKDEYNLTVRKLLGITGSPGVNLPEENEAFGFKNIATILSVTNVSIDRYLDASEAAVGEAFTNNSATVFTCNNQRVSAATLSRACADEIIGRIGEAAYRRPMTAAERTQALASVDAAIAQSQPVSEGLRWGLESILVSPSFLFRVIQHPAPNDPATVKTLDGNELATRMSYFLWSSSPDAQLKAAGANGTLTQLPIMEAQVMRMLQDPQAQALVEGFAKQWLQIHRFETQNLDSAIYNFPAATRNDMVTETNMFLRDSILGNAGVLSLINADYSYLNANLASHYGVTGAPASGFGRVSLANTERRGLMGQGSVLVSTSLPTRTSVVRRGKWILDNIICEPPPAPPAAVEGLPGDPGGSLKDKMAAHRNNPVCASCHNSIDPAGFALERFDADAKWRNTYRDGQAVDTAGVMPDGKPVAGALSLSKILENDPRFRTCVTKKLMTYALGRALAAEDQCTVNRLAQDQIGPAVPFSTLVKGVVTSDPFRKQSGVAP